MQSIRPALVTLIVMSFARLASADAPVRIALFKTAAEDATSTELAAALDPVVLTELSSIAAVEITTRPALDLPSMQLAIDCVGETAECLRISATQADAEGLVAPAVRRAGDETVVTLLRYDAVQATPIQRVSRRYAGERTLEAALAGVEEMLRELYGVPNPAQPPPPPAPATAPPPEPLLQPTAAEPRPARAGVPVLPIVLGAVGIALIGTGIGLGIAADNSHDDYLAIRVRDQTATEDVKRAQAKFDTANTQATLANLSLGVGAATLVAGGVLLILHLRRERADSTAAWSPRIGPREVGLTFTTAWDASL